MSAGGYTPGVRVIYDPVARDFDENGHPRQMHPGEYWRDLEGTWHCCTPGAGHFGNLRAHQVTEHPDGTATVAPSIAILIPHPDSTPEVPLSPVMVWHGYLEGGQWREV